VAERQQPVALSVRLPFASPEEFLQRYGQNLSKGGIYLRSKALKAPGTTVTLEIKLESGQRVIYASSVVSYVTGNKGEGVPGMGFKFITLAGASRRFLESAAAAMPHARSSDPPVPKSVGPADYSPEAVAPPAPAPSQEHATLPSEEAGHLVVASGAQVQAPAPAVEVPAEAPERKGPIVGIDLGTSNSAVSVVRDGKAALLRGKDNQPILPSVVALTPQGKLVVGAPAKAMTLTNPRAAVWGFKRLLGRPFDSPDVQELINRFPWEVVPTEVGDCAVRLGDRVYRLEETSAVILRELKEIATLRLGTPVSRAVITVPAWYNEKQRLAVREAGRIAGLYVERIVNEPTAAALAYGYGRKLSKRVLVYDLGGGTFDASVLELNDTVYEVVSTGGDNFLGGIDFDNTIVAHLKADFEQQHGQLLVDRVSLGRVTDACEKAKILLSTATEAKIHVPFVAMVKGKPVDIEETLTRARLTDLTRHLVDRTATVCQEVLQARNLRADQIDEIILVGGQSKAPLVQDRITVLFGRQPSSGVNPDEAVAMGAALLGHALQEQEGVLLIDVLPMSIGIGLPGGRFHPIIPRNTALPATRKHRVSTTRDDQEEIELSIFQGESPTAKANAYLGTFMMSELTKAPRGSVTVELTFELNNECLLAITAREVEGSDREVKAVFSTQDTPEQVKKRIASLEAEKIAETKKKGFFGRLFGG